MVPVCFDGILLYFFKEDNTEKHRKNRAAINYYSYFYFKCLY